MKPLVIRDFAILSFIFAILSLLVLLFGSLADPQGHVSQEQLNLIFTFGYLGFIVFAVLFVLLWSRYNDFRIKNKRHLLVLILATLLITSCASAHGVIGNNVNPGQYNSCQQ